MFQKNKKYLLPVFISLLFAFVLFVFLIERTNSKKDFTFAMLDVGQGDAFFIESPSGVQVLIDAGPPQNILKELSRVMPFWDRSIDFVIITNPDKDHIAGFLDVFKIYKIGAVFEPGTINSSDTYKLIEREIKEKNIPNVLARANTKISLGAGAQLEILFPDRDVFDWANNTASVVAKLTYGENTILFMGDATKETESILLQKYQSSFLDSDILKIGHHGSNTSTSEDFLKVVSPEYALISSGKDNKYGHPHKEVLDILTENNVEILLTDQNGTFIFSCDTIEKCKIKK